MRKTSNQLAPIWNDSRSSVLPFIQHCPGAWPELSSCIVKQCFISRLRTAVGGTWLYLLRNLIALFRRTFGDNGKVLCLATSLVWLLSALKYGQCDLNWIFNLLNVNQLNVAIGYHMRQYRSGISLHGLVEVDPTLYIELNRTFPSFKALAKMYFCHVFFKCLT